LPESGTPAAGEGDGGDLRGAEILPATGRARVTRLSALIGFQVQDSNGNSLGTASDYILNMCEAHIVYLVLDADPALQLAGGDRLVIPYEVVTLGGGTIDTEAQAIVLNVDASQLSGAPAAAESPDLTATDWEADVRTFWNEQVTLSNLSTTCRVPPADLQTEPGGAAATEPVVTEALETEPVVTESLETEAVETEATPGESETPQAGQASGERVSVTKITDASEILGMALQSGNGEPLGQVEEVILEPESGRLRYLAVTLDEALEAGGGTVMVPVRAVNLQAEEGAEAQTLVLLVEPAILQGAPHLASLPAADDTTWEDPALEYWSQHVPLGGEE
jgi:sporulation protein YlmC with PRC-barrel domain